MSALALATATLLVAAAPPPAPVASDVVEHHLRLDDQGQVAVSDLMTVALAELGLRVRVAPDALPGAVTLDSSEGRLALAALGLGLAPLGVTLRLEPPRLVVRVDRVLLGDRIDDLEAALRSVLGDRAPVYTLERVRGAQDGGRPVVLIHGLDASADGLRGAAAAIARRGYDVHLFHYPDDGRVTATAEALGHLLRQLHADTGRKIVLVTTSMGGVVARTYLELDPTCAGEVSHLIAACPPFRGSPMARFHVLGELAETFGDVLTDGFSGFFPFDGLGQAAMDLAPDSLLIGRLRASKPRAGVRYSILAGKGDIVPAEAFDALAVVLGELRRRASSPSERLLVDTMREVARTAASVSGGKGDGAVPLASQTMDGVTDRVVLDVDHLEMLAGEGRDGPIPGLAEVLSRLPRP